MVEISAARIIQRIRANGANVTVGPDGLHIFNKQNLPAGALEFIGQHKSEIVAALEAERAEPAPANSYTFGSWLTRDRAEELSRLLMANDPGDPDWTWFVSEAMKIMDGVAA
jgi:hypothetical protein